MSRTCRKDINRSKASKSPDSDKMFGFIQDRAFRLWDEAGRPKDCDWEFWFQAEKEIKKRIRKLRK